MKKQRKYVANFVKKEGIFRIEHAQINVKHQAENVSSWSRN